MMAFDVAGSSPVLSDPRPPVLAVSHRSAGLGARERWKPGVAAARRVHVRSQRLKCCARSDAETAPPDTSEIPTSQSGASGRASLLWLALYLVGGAVFYKYAMGWKLVECAYFVMVTLTTVGYGDLVPTSPASRVFTAVYAVVGAFLVATGVSNAISALLTRQEAALAKILKAQPGNDMQRDAEMKRRRLNFALAIVQYLFVLLCGAIGFSMLNKISLWDGLYFSIITALTVGYGDFAPTTAIGRGLSVIWLLLATFGFARLLSAATELNLQERTEAFRKKLLDEPITPERFDEIDADGDNRLSKYEYLQWVLIQEGHVSQEDVSEILDRFDELDQDSSGTIDRGEVIR